MATVQLRTLGECALETEAGRIGPDSKYVFALGLYLVLERGKRIPRQALVDLLWPDVNDESQARHRFRQTLLRLKQLGVPVWSDQGHLRIERASVVADFDSLLHVNGDAEGVVTSRESFEFLHGYQPRISEQFATWLDLHRARVELAIQRVFVHALKSARDRGDWGVVEQLALSLLRIDPLNEEATMARAEATAMRGSKAQALRILDGYMDALGERSLAIGLPAKMLRSRIAERMTQPQYVTLSEAHFVGREEEVALLTRMLDQAAQSRGGAILFSGPAGIGKTRLVTEITRIALLKGTTIAPVNCQPSSVDRPIGLLADLVTVLRGLPGALGASVESLALLQRLTEYTEPAPTTPDFAETGMAAAAIRRAVFDLFEAVAEENTLLVTIEDAHWADAFSWKMVRTLAESVSRRRVLIVVTSRDRSANLPDDCSAESLHFKPLLPLDTLASEALVAKLLAEHSSDIPEAMLAWCVSVADGNPYYLRELVTRWLETREPFGVPQSLAELVDRKISRLSSDALRVLQACVALGSLSTVARLERIEATEPTQLMRAIEELSLGDLVFSDGVQIQPKHDVLAQAARERMPRALQALVHRRIATALEAESAALADASILWQCALHWELAGDQQRAVNFLADCGSHMLSVGLPEEATGLYRKALATNISAFEDQIPFRQGLINALAQSGLLDQALREIEEFRSSAEKNDYHLQAHSPLELQEVDLKWRSNGLTFGALDELLVCICSPDATPTHRLQAAYWALALAQNLGETEYADRVWRYVQPLVSHAQCEAAVKFQLSMVYHADYGDLEEAARYARSWVKAERQQGSPVRLIRSMKNAALCLRRAGFLGEARALLQETFDTAVRHHAAYAAFDAAHQSISLAIQEGEWSAAAEWQAQAASWCLRCETRFLAQDLAITNAILAVSTGNLCRATELMMELPDWRTDVRLRRKQLVASTVLAIQVLTPTPMIDRELLAECHHMHQRIRSRGHQDYSVEWLTKAYAHIGDSTTAMDLLTEYLAVRRDRGPLAATLASSPVFALIRTSGNAKLQATATPRRASESKA